MSKRNGPHLGSRITPAVLGRRWLPGGLPIALLLLCLMLATPLGSRAAEQTTNVDRKSVLVLNSYHWGAEWAEGEVRGVLSVLKSSDLHIEWFVEQMDMLRKADSFDDAYFRDHLRKLYGQQSLDLIIVTDDPALRFVARHYHELFPGAPVVFSDVGRPGDIDLPPDMPVTGVMEHTAFVETLELARRLRPKARQIVVFGNEPDLGSGPRTAQKALSEMKLDIPMRVLNDLSLEEMVDTVSQLSPEDIVIPLALGSDQKGRHYTYEEVNERLVQDAPTPLFGFWSLGVRAGYLLGGKVNDPQWQGEAAARMGLRILHGEDPRRIPVMHEAPTQYMFSYPALLRYGIPESALPQGSIILDKPPSLYEENKALIWATLGTLVILIASNMMLVLNIRRRKEAQRALRDSEERLRLTLAAANQGLYDLDIPSGNALVSPEYARMLGYEPGELQETNARWVARLHPDDKERTFGVYGAYIAGQLPDYEVEFRQRTKQGDWKWILSLGKIVERDGAGRPLRLLGTHTDITRRKLAEAEREALLRVLDSSLNEIYVFDAQTLRFRYVNTGALRNLGYTAEAMASMTPVDLKTQYDEVSFRELIGPLVRAEQDQVVFFAEHRRADASRYPVEVHLSRAEYQGEPACVAIILDLTEHRAAEQARQRSEAVLAATLESINEGVLVVSGDARVSHCNARFREIWSVPEQLLALGDDQALIEHAKGQLSDPLAFTEKIGEIYGSSTAFEDVLSFRDGRRVERLSFPLQGVPDERGRVWLFRDVTEREQAAVALRDSEERFRSIFEHAPMGIALAQGEDGRIVACNPHMTRLVGYGADELCGMSFKDVTHPDDLEKDVTKYLAILAGELSHFSMEKRYVRKGGSVVWVYLTVSAIRDEQGRPRYAVAMVEDITERKRADDALRSALTRLETVITGAPVVLFSFDRDGVFTLSEGRGLEGMGLRPGEVVGHSALDLYKDQPAILSNIRRAVAGETFTARVRIGEHEYLAYHTPLLAGDDPAGGTIGVLVDITDQASAEEALRRLNEELELRVLQRTAELEASNQNYRQALDKLQRAQADLVRSEKLAGLGSLVAGVAHELSTPLGASVTLASALADRLAELRERAERDELDRAALASFIAMASEASELLTRTLLQSSAMIRDFKQVAVDQTSAQRRHFELAEVVGEVVATLQPQFKKSLHRVRVTVPAGLQMDSFPGPLGQIITNLVRNAQTHAFAEGTAGEVTISATGLGEARVRLTVEDNGRGIPAEHLPRVFDPFFTTRLGQGGSGLGLHIVYNVATRILGGRIDVTSQLGKGTRFILHVPRRAPITERGAALEPESEDAGL